MQAAIQCLVHGCLRPHSGPDGGVELKCDPDDEALLYQGSVEWGEPWRLQCRSVCVAAGENSSFPHTPEFYDEFTRERGWVHPTFVAPGCGHFSVMESPGWAAGFVLRSLWPEQPSSAADVAGGSVPRAKL